MKPDRGYPGRVYLEKVISGEADGIWPGAVRAGLWLLKPVYRTAIGLRNLAFDFSLCKSRRASKPVIAIGNLTVGGTGKTPLVAWLADRLLTLSIKPAIVSRGYGSTAHQPNDEFLELKLRLPDVEHLQNSNRFEAAQQVIKDFDPEVVLLDDGFQHRHLARDVDIVLIDCTNPFGYGHVLPRGLLREPISALRRAHAVILTRIDQVSSAASNLIKSAIMATLDNNPAMLFAEVAFVATRIITSDDRSIRLEELSDMSVTAFCGIGNPHGFDRLLQKQMGDARRLQTVNAIRFPDHHQYNENDIAAIIIQAEKVDSELVVCTVKDFVKVKKLWPKDGPVLGAIVIETRFLSGEEQIVSLVLGAMKREA